MDVHLSLSVGSEEEDVPPGELGNFHRKVEVPVVPVVGQWIEVFRDGQGDPTDQGYVPTALIMQVTWLSSFIGAELQLILNLPSIWIHDRPWRQHLREGGWSNGVRRVVQ